MKQFPCVILMACMLLISAISHAQIKQGEKMLGANLSYYSYDEDGEEGDETWRDKNSEFNFNPQLGFGLANNWIFGIQAGVNSWKNSEKEDDNDAVVEKGTTFSVGVFARKWQPFSDRVGIFGQGSVDFAFGKEKYPAYEEDDKVTGISAYVRPGLYFFASKKIIVEATFGQLGYSRFKYTNDEVDYEEKTSEFTASFTDGLSFGVKFVL